MECIGKDEVGGRDGTVFCLLATVVKRHHTNSLPIFGLHASSAIPWGFGRESLWWDAFCLCWPKGCTPVVFLPDSSIECIRKDREMAQRAAFWSEKGKWQHTDTHIHRPGVLSVWDSIRKEGFLLVVGRMVERWPWQDPLAWGAW